MNHGFGTFDANTEKTCAEYIELILKRGGRWRNKQVEAAILNTYGVVFQNNTIAKYLSFAINSGKVLSGPVETESGKACFEYWWIQEQKKAKSSQTIFKSDIDIEGLKEKCIKAAQSYPIDHPELIKIKQQIRELELK